MWKPIKGFEGYYEANELGQIKSLKHTFVTKNGQRYTKREKILKPTSNKQGYLKVNVCINGKRYTRFVHQLVALAFLDNPENKPQIDHKNVNTQDNRVENLHWVTAKENSNMPLHRSNITGDKNGFFGKKHSKETRQKVAESNKRRSGANSNRSQPVINLDTGKTFVSFTEASRSLGLSDKAVYRAVKRGGKCAGFRWAVLPK